MAEEGKGRDILAEGAKLNMPLNDTANLLHYFDRDMLEQFQRAISKATGLAFITVDYRGEPVTENTNFTEHCQCMRSDPERMKNCFASDAYGAIQAAVSREPNVYFCPNGLIEMAVPIIIYGHYMGGFIGGQFRCEDAPEMVSRLYKLTHIQETAEERQHRLELFNKIPLSTYEHVTDVARLVSLIINQLCLREFWKQTNQDQVSQELAKISEEEGKWLEEKKAAERKIQELSSRYNPYFLRDSLAGLAHLAAAGQTEQMEALSRLLARYVQATLVRPQAAILLQEELEEVSIYLDIQKLKSVQPLSYAIQVEGDLSGAYVPHGILTAAVAGAVCFGTACSAEPGNIRLTLFRRQELYTARIEDNGPGTAWDESEGSREGAFIRKRLAWARTFLGDTFGEQGLLNIEHHLGQGSVTLLQWPEYFV